MTPRPYSYDMVGCAKWDSWSQHEEKSRSDAASEYVALVGSLGWNPSSATTTPTRAEKKKKKKKKAGMGLSVSTMAIGDMKRLEEEQDGHRDGGSRDPVERDIIF